MENVCQALANMTELRDGYNGVGFSQGMHWSATTTTKTPNTGVHQRQRKSWEIVFAATFLAAQHLRLRSRRAWYFWLCNSINRQVCIIFLAVQQLNEARELLVGRPAILTGVRGPAGRIFMRAVVERCHHCDPRHNPLHMQKSRSTHAVLVWLRNAVRVWLRSGSNKHQRGGSVHAWWRAASTVARNCTHS